MPRHVLAATALLACAGCASTQVNNNTLDIASTYDQLITKQVTFNLEKTIESPFSIPAFVKVSVQSATTMNSINPSLTFPLTAQISKLAQSAMGPTGLTTQFSNTNQFAGESFSIGASDQWNQTYTITPVTDPDQLRRLRILFQYATRSLPEVDYAESGALAEGDKVFEASYPIIEASSSSGGSESNLTVTIDNKSVAVKQASSGAGPQKKRYVRRQFALDAQQKIEGYTWSIVSPDRTFITQPGCIICDYGTKLTKADLTYTIDQDILQHYDSFTVLEKNRALRATWLYTSQAMPAAGTIPLPSAGLSRLYANDAAGLKYFYEFVLFCVEASSQGTGSPSSGGQSEGRKTAPPQTIFSIPVSP